MKNIAMTLQNGKELPPIGLGTFGSDKYGAEEIARAVYGAVRCGYRMIDCASVYGNEREIGDSLSRLYREGVVSRDEIFLTGKVWNDMHGRVAESCEKTLSDLQTDAVDLYFVHWPFPNYHAPGCDGDARSEDARPFSREEFLCTWRQMEELVRRGRARYIGMSNMTVSKLEQVLPLCEIMPAALEMELHPSFQQQGLYDYALSRGIRPIGYCPMGSPSRPERDRAEGDIADVELPGVFRAAENHGISPFAVCIKWAVGRGQIPIPFSVKEQQYAANLLAATGDPLTDAEMDDIARDERNCRLVKGQVFLWKGAGSWREIWDET